MNSFYNGNPMGLTVVLYILVSNQLIITVLNRHTHPEKMWSIAETQIESRKQKAQLQLALLSSQKTRVC